MSRCRGWRQEMRESPTAATPRRRAMGGNGAASPPLSTRVHWPTVVVLTCALAVGTIVACHVVARTSPGHLPPWLWAPAISFTGILYPERWIYVGGFGCVTVAFMFMAAEFVSRLGRRVEPRNAGLLRWGLTTATWAFYALFGQAAFPMQRDIVKYLYEVDDMDRQSLTLVSMAHQASAISFFLLAIVHAAIMLRLYATDKVLPVGCANVAAAARHHGTVWWRVRAAVLTAVILPSAAWPLLHPGTLGVTTQARANLLLGGLTQWAAVASVIAFFATYARDFAVMDWEADAARHGGADGMDGDERGGNGAAAMPSPPSVPRPSRRRANGGAGSGGKV